MTRPPAGGRKAGGASTPTRALSPAVGASVEDEQPAPFAPPIDVPAPRLLPVAALLSLIPEALGEVPPTGRETRNEAAESVRDVIYDAMRQAGAPARGSGRGKRRRVAAVIRISRREGVRDDQPRHPARAEPNQLVQVRQQLTESVAEPVAVAESVPSKDRR